MPRTDEDDEEDWEGPDDDREDPDDADIDDHDHLPAEMIDCPYCGEPIYEQADLCPHCRSYISREDSRPRRPKWLVIGAVVTVLVILVVWVIKGR